MLIRLRTIINGESGQSFVLVALILAGLLGFGALVTDVGFAYYQKSYLQNAADSAALAGALEAVANTNDNGVYIVVDQYITNNLKGKGSLGTPERSIDRTNQTVTVKISQDIPKFLAGILTSTNHSITVSAKAKYSGWAGQALPFVNMDDDYTASPQIVAWEKTAPGDFETIRDSDFYVVNSETPSVYFVVTYLDGITLKKGVVANGTNNTKDNLALYYAAHKGQNVYIFSLNNSIINDTANSGKVLLADGTYKYLYGSGSQKLQEGDVIALSQLVLLKCTFDAYDEQAKKLTLTYKSIYDIANNQFPTDDAISNLIE